MKSYLLLFVYFLFSVVEAHAQALKWKWLEEADSTGYQVVHDIAVDANRNAVYVVGGFNNSLSANYGGNTTYGGRDGFVSKFDTLGNLRWSFNVGGNQDDELLAIDIDFDNSDILVTGYCSGNNVNFRGVHGSNNSESGYGGKDVLIATYDFSGELQNRRIEGGLGDDIGRDIIAIPDFSFLKPSRFVYTGVFHSEMKLVSSGIDVGPNDGNKHMFVASRFSANYSFDWRGYSTGRYQSGVALVRNNEEVYLVGDYESNTVIEVEYDQSIVSNGSHTSITLSNINTNKNIFCARLDVFDGEPKNFFSIESPGEDRVGSVNYRNNKLYIGGSVSNNVTFGNSAVFNGILGQEAFVSIHDVNSNESYLTKILEPNNTATTSSIINAIDFTSDYLVTGGKTDGSIRFNNTPSNILVDNGSNSEGFVAIYTSDVVYFDRKEVDGNGTNEVKSLKGFGRNVFVGGAFGRIANFDTDITVGSTGDDESGFLSLLAYKECDPGFTYPFQSLCSESPLLVPNFIADSGGVFSQVGSGVIIDVNTGIIDPFTSAGGFHQIIYTTFPGCADTFNLSITKGVVPQFTGKPNDTILYTPSNGCSVNYSYGVLSYLQDCGKDSVEQIDNSGLTSGNGFPLGVHQQIYTLSDGYNPNDTAKFTVTVIDNVSPEIFCPNDTIIYSSKDSCGTLVRVDVSAVDNCSSSLSIVQTGNTSYANNTFFPVSLTPYTLSFKAVDASNNASTCSINVTVLDSIKPEIVNCPIIDTIVAFSSDNSCTKEVDLSLVSSKDSCGIASFTKSFDGVIVNHNLFQLDTTDVVFQSVDNFGNIGTCNFTVVVKDTTSPEFSNCPSDTIKLYVSDSECLKNVTFVSPLVTDNCSFTLAQTLGFMSGDNRPVGIDTLEFVAVDLSGNSSSCRIYYSILDTIKPTLICPSSVTINADIQRCEAQYYYSDFTASDNCLLATPSPVQMPPSLYNSGSFFPLGTTTLNYQQQDINGNVATCSFDVNVVNYETAAFVNVPIGVCNDSDSLALINYIQGNSTGTFFGGGVYDGIFYPDSVSVTSSIGYSIGQGACLSTVNHTISVYTFESEIGDSLVVCGLSSTLEGNEVAGTLGEWLQLNNEIYNPSRLNSSTTVSESVEGDYIYVWQLSKDQCYKTDTIFVSFNEQPYSIVGENITVDVDEVVLDSEQALGEGVWSIVSSEGIIEDSSYNNTYVSGLNLGLNTFQWKVTNSPCPSDSSVFRVFYDKLTVPNAFTPNGDGINDVFKIEGFELYSDAKLTILDRWGELIFFTDQSNEYWNGEYKGKQVAEDTYFYILLINGEEHTGYIELRR